MTSDSQKPEVSPVSPVPSVPSIPPDLRKRLSSSVSEARVLLRVMLSLKPSGKTDTKSDDGHGTRLDASLYRTTAFRFKRVASELTHRFDTMSYFLSPEDLGALARSLGCTWDARASRLRID